MCKCCRLKDAYHRWFSIKCRSSYSSLVSWPSSERGCSSVLESHAQKALFFVRFQEAFYEVPTGSSRQDCDLGSGPMEHSFVARTRMGTRLFICSTSLLSESREHTTLAGRQTPWTVKEINLSSSSQLIQHSVDVCGSYLSCEECVGSGDPVCGWCALESRSAGNTLLLSQSASLGSSLSLSPPSPASTNPSLQVQSLCKLFCALRMGEWEHESLPSHLLHRPLRNIHLPATGAHTCIPIAESAMQVLYMHMV